MEKPRPATIAWGVLAAGVVAYDALCPKEEMLSEGFDRALERPVGRYLALGGLAITAAHLANVFDAVGLQHADPIHRLSKFIPKS